ncbi:MAG: hypothetical protein NVSMB7_12680 [Chitinophagaceae bacterium]
MEFLYLIDVLYRFFCGVAAKLKKQPFMRSLQLCLCLCLLTILFTDLSAQKEAAFPEIKKGSLPEKGIYRFPAFTEGTVVMRNGIISSQKLNYNISLDEMHFISEKGDTLSLSDPPAVNFISMKGGRFYYDKGYLQTIDTTGGIILAFRQLLSVQQHHTTAYGMTEPHEGTRSYSFYTGNGQTYKMGNDEKVTVTVREYYFFGDAYGHFSKTGKIFILQHFGKQEDAIQAFLKTHHTNFNKLGDLQQLLVFCRQL